MTPAFPSAERKPILDRIFQLFAAAEACEAEDGLDSPAYGAISQELMDLAGRYVAGIPVLPLSRCPFTGDVFSHSLDTAGLDGLWWNSDSPQRPVETLLPTFFAFSGAMQLAKPVEAAPFIAEPGPGLPFVLPRLLAYQQVKAVLSTVPVGQNTGFVVTYFADPMLYTEARVNDWGSNRYQYTDETGRSWINEGPADDLRHFDLAPWIQSGQLLWIRPGDPELTLHSDLETCPYLDLEGPLANQFVQHGRVWTQQEPAAMSETDYPFTPEAIQQLLLAEQQGG